MATPSANAHTGKPRTADDSRARSLASDPSWREVAVVGLGGVLVAVAFGAEVWHWSPIVFWLAIGLSVPLTSARTSRRAFEALVARRIDVDVLMFVAAIGAGAIGHAVEGGFLLFLFGLGAAGEHMAMDRAERSLRSLERLAPERAERRREDGTFEEVDAAELGVGDVVRVRSFERIACDGVVVAGETAIDESTLTGESMPVEKRAGSEVFGGTLNAGSAFEYSVSRVASQSALARVVEVVTEARTHRTRVEMLTERIGAWYAPGVLVASGILFAVPVMMGEPASVWFYRAMAFLTAASPCALAIGAPATYLCGIAAGARQGIVFKGSESVERLAHARAFALDKTGTLTRGQPRVHEVVVMTGSREGVLSLAAALELLASHPLADAIVREAEASAIDAADVSQITQIAGTGVEGKLGDEHVMVGSSKIVKEQMYAAEARAAIERLTAEACSVVVVVRGETILGVIGVRDEVRPDARAAITALAARGLHAAMLTGDHAGPARIIAMEVGIDDVQSELSPQDKMQRLGALERTYGPVAMVGDGANDAPALARASVSLSMGAAASDVAAESADIAIMGERLESVVIASDLARRTSRIMRQNLFIALAVIATVAPIAAAGYAGLTLAVVLHEGSTVVVVLNALRLLRIRKAPGAGRLEGS
jgi:Cd2+/Zn2+-exporting ATPase